MPGLTTAIQELCLALLCYDEVGGKQIQGILEENDYDPYFREIAEQAVNFWNRFKTAPKAHTLDLVEACKLKNPKAAETFSHLFKSLNRTKDNINCEYVIDRASKFARIQRIKRGAGKMLELLQQDGDDFVDEAGKVITEAFKSSNHLFNAGSLLNDPKQALTFLDNEQDDFFSVGIKEADAFGLGPARKTMWMLMALSGMGKSWGCVHFGKHGLRSRKKVLHITLEMREKEISKRYIQSLFSVTTREATIIAQSLEKDELGRFIGYEEYELKDRPSLKDGDIRKFLTGRLRGLKNRPSLYIKDFPTGFLTISKLIGYLDGLEAAEGFIPDLLIIDSPDQMDFDLANARLSISKNHNQLRGVAMDRNLALVVTTQSNASGYKSKTLRGHNTSEAMAKYHVADTVVTYNQTDSEQELGLARLFWDKVRAEKKNLSLLISQSYAIGQFCLDSAKMASKIYWDRLDKEGESDEKEKDD